ncbi:hypothetical protein [Rhizobacter sp. LjRoot28]|uniref:hypothetical protein n=1 Tax=Rhizobacter sp. LjRoot28 TaxID=3342309 RepID=UPI003ECF8169
MKTLRFWLILLLVALLPLRGAFAAAMLCGPAGGMSSMVVMAPLHSSANEHVAHDHGSHDHSSDHHTATDAAVADPGGSGGLESASQPGHDKCNMCSAFCSAATLLTEMPTVATPVEFAHVNFGKLSASAPSFISGGPERPPRSI